ncbi:MAG: hypothetical protein ACOCTH_01545 [Halodesulfurarchaeum sp.]
MPHEAYVQLVCPECRKAWEATPSDLPNPVQNYSCPNCHATRRVAEFMRTDRDLKNLKKLS